LGIVKKKYTKKQVIASTEKYVSAAMKNINIDVHGYGHVDRVRKWALKIGKAEGGVDLFLLEMSALLHDIGRVDETKKVNHYLTGAKAARKYLDQLGYFSKEEIAVISKAVLGHGTGKGGRVAKIIRDADMLDSGAVGIGRAFSFFANKPFYIGRKSFDFSNWTPKKTEGKYDTRPWEQSVVDSLMFVYHNDKKCRTETAKKIVKKNSEFLRKFIKKFESEIFN
jgi:uncharacterized protein